MIDKNCYGTPFWLFDKLDEEFRFNVDVCASKENHKHYYYYTEKQDGLSIDWFKDVSDRTNEQPSCFMNPPYGRGLTNKWLKKGYEESLKGCIVVCLIPSRTSTLWWHDNIPKASQIRFLKGRVKFIGAEAGAKFPNAVVVYNRFGNYKEKYIHVDYRGRNV
jgi:site-specific DNA-methyltransferase (adenine-specific)